MNARDIGEYFAEFRPTKTSVKPCECGDTVFYQLTEGAPWRCRSCAPLGHSGWRTVVCRHEPQCNPPEHIRSAVLRWFVLTRAGVRSASHD
jgi:hypothetical protein